MNFKRTCLSVCAAAVALTAAGQTGMGQKGCVVVTDYISNDGKKDVSDAIQKIIDANPNRTIFFPDGAYLISKPILTPADPKKSVALLLSNYAVIRADAGWKHEEAMIRLGGKDPFNSITIPGSNYYLDGGVIDGSGVAKGVSIDSGRETAVRNTSIKNVTIGLHIKTGANSGSSDCDIHDVNITGNETPQSIGVLIEGYDNTLTNMRIGGVHTGVYVKSSGNMLRNLHPLFYNKSDFESSCGFADEGGNNWYDFCYSDQFATGFYTNGGASLYDNCFAFWYSNRGEKHTVFRSAGKFNARVMNMNAGISKGNAAKENKILEASEDGGDGVFFNLKVADIRYVTDTSHEKYMAH